MLRKKIKHNKAWWKKYCTVFAARPDLITICPYCNTAQSRERDFCCQCGAKFIYLTETNRYCV